MATIVDGTDGITAPGLASTAGQTIATTLDVTGATTLASLQVNGIATDVYPVVSGTAVSPASGTSINFASIPSYAKRIIVMFNNVSTSGTSPIIIQIGVNTPTVTGYLGSAANIASSSTSTAFTTGFGATSANSNVTFWHGSVQIYSVGSNAWVSSTGMAQSNLPIATCGGGSVTLSGVLNYVRITTVNGTDAFDSGRINIMWD